MTPTFGAWKLEHYLQQILRYLIDLKNIFESIFLNTRDTSHARICASFISLQIIDHWQYCKRNIGAKRKF